MIVRSIADYEYRTGHAAARHQTYAPFACRCHLILNIERSPFRDADFVIVERCSYDGRLVNAWKVLATDDEDDDA